ncbi:hypothetical protein FDUTEX481_01520 [Tolypothrix sp. PCC 7601]|nr:hypothetical protein FDUTEX481_01520 [Tolypothrix sp. PCC 7601]
MNYPNLCRSSFIKKGTFLCLYLHSKLIDNKTKKLITQQKNRTIILEGVWGTQPSPNRGFGGESPN